MGFGFNLFFAFLLLPLTVVLLLVWLASRRAAVGHFLGTLWLGVALLVGLVGLIHFFTDKKELSHADIYGSYVIDRTKFPGRQADWQYNHFRFDITPPDKFQFYVTDGPHIVRSYHGRAYCLSSYRLPRLVLQIDSSHHHIIEPHPTLYRTPWSFYYVFYSPEFGNVFFTKGQWQPIN